MTKERLKEIEALATEAICAGDYIFGGALAEAVIALGARTNQINEDLEKLNAPSPGLRVRGEGPDGPFEWARLPTGDGWAFETQGDGGYMPAYMALPIVKALVSSGAAQVVEGEV